MSGSNGRSARTEPINTEKIQAVTWLLDSDVLSQPVIE